MQLGIDSRPMQGEKAGIGEYVHCLIQALIKIDSHNNYFLFSEKPLPISLPNNFHNMVIAASPFWHSQVAWVARSKKMVFHATHSLIDATLLSNRCVLTVHDTTALDFSRTHSLKVKLLSTLLFTNGVKKAGAVIVPSKTVKEQVLTKVKVPSEKLFVVHEAVSDTFTKENHTQVLTKYNLQKGYIFFNATIEPRKNLPLFLHAYANITNRPPLVIAGAKGWGFKEVESTIRDLKLENSVHVLGWVEDDDLPTLYSAAKVFVYPSLAEGFGLSPLKALKVGVPTLVADLPVAHEILDDAVAYANPLNENDLQVVLERLLSDENLRKDLSQKGLLQVQNYTWEKTARSTLEVYERVHYEIN